MTNESNALLHQYFLTHMIKNIDLDYVHHYPTESGSHQMWTYKAMKWDKESRELYQAASGHDIHPRSVLYKYHRTGNVETY